MRTCTLIAAAATMLTAFAMLNASLSMAQTENATISGRITDSSGAILPEAIVELQSADKGTMVQTKTNTAGLYIFASVHPGIYHLRIRKDGFRTEDYVGLTVNTQDHLEQNFRMTVGAVSESITVTGDELHVNTEDATVSTVVDRNFAENLPMNGRSFQTLIQLTPGVVLTVSNSLDSGQFSVNGQRANTNYWMVDGVGANVGLSATPTPGNGLAGSLGAFSVQGGTNSLVSVDALQEFRIQTSAYAPEFGRTPGGQISIVTRSGTNRMHGTVFDYFRNDILDANDWFNGDTNVPPLPKAEERQNDFGGTLGGPIFRDRTFFFFSYEGLRLRLPQTAITTVPDLAARQNALPAMRPYLNEYPLPNGADDLSTGIAQFNASYSNASALDAYSLRIDHKPTDKLNLFARYNYSPSTNTVRGPAYSTSALSVVTPTRITLQTATVGTTWAISNPMANDLRFNYSQSNGRSTSRLDNFGGAVPVLSPTLPPPYTDQNASSSFYVAALQNGFIFQGKNTHQKQQQLNIIDNLSEQKGSHGLKFGVDFRRLTPLFDPPVYTQFGAFADIPSAEAGTLNYAVLSSSRSGMLLLRNLGAFAQDTWRALPRLTMTYGLRWDVDFAPASISGPSLPAAQNVNNLSQLALAPAGTPPFHTTYGNLAPRIGVAYQLTQNQNWQTVLRGGFGVFFDLATQEAGNNINSVSFPFGSEVFNFNATYPLGPGEAIPPPITAAGGFFAYYPHFQLPYTLQWNTALEQALGSQQTLTVSYIGAAGRRLSQSEYLLQPSFTASNVLVVNAATSDYDALQVQFQRRLLHGLQALASYTWAHSIDSASAGSIGVLSNAFVPGANGNANRGPSDFDIRNSLSVAATWNIPAPIKARILRGVLQNWSTENIVQVRTAPPVDISDANFFEFKGGFVGSVRPDFISGQSYYLLGSAYPGGKAFNPAAFTNPPADPNTGLPLRQGNVSRNVLRGFGAGQWDFAFHRDFPIHESVKLQFRAEVFNLLNHPNFGQPSGQFGVGGFGLSTQMLGRSLDAGNLGGGSQSPLYQIGGPRSIQLALKMSF